MATDRLKIYNGACLLLGEIGLNPTTGLTENREIRTLLDAVWDDGGVRFCLEQAQWHFAMRTSRFDYDPSITTQYGLSKAFSKPSDWVLTSGVFAEEYLQTPLLEYADEAGYWYADLDEIYVRYVSDDASYGTNYASWPATFTDYVKAYFAGRIVHRIPSASKKIEFLLGPSGRPDKGWVNYCLQIAKNKAAMALPTTFPSRGTWASARHRNTHPGRRDGGSITNLIG